ncbi:hypothetical protein ACF090_07825 [Streptomyces sp. NPDC014892]
MGIQASYEHRSGLSWSGEVSQRSAAQSALGYPPQAAVALVRESLVMTW